MASAEVDERNSLRFTYNQMLSESLGNARFIEIRINNVKSNISKLHIFYIYSHINIFLFIK